MPNIGPRPSGVSDIDLGASHFNQYLSTRTAEEPNTGGEPQRLVEPQSLAPR